MMHIDILTLFPDMCNTVLNESIIGRARRKGIVNVECHQIRDYTYDKHKRVDDTVYGPGMGMLMKAEPIAKCFEAICEKREKKPKFIYMSPQGKRLNQSKVKELATEENIAILCGHYEGVDERLIEEFIDEQISIGDFVVTGGELPALILTDSIIRIIPGVLSNSECFEEESYYNGLLEYPQYTKPAIWRNKAVPDILLSGHHKNIKKWRMEQSFLRTKKVRPDLLQNTKTQNKNK